MDLAGNYRAVAQCVDERLPTDNGPYWSGKMSSYDEKIVIKSSFALLEFTEGKVVMYGDDYYIKEPVRWWDLVTSCAAA
jgi:hypothetical protein